jgi:hypothetical protein
MNVVKQLCAIALVATSAGFGPIAFSTPAFAESCTKSATVCPVVPETNYHGTSNVKPKIQVTVCFADLEYGYITRPDGTNEWVVHLRYQKGGGFDRIDTVHNAQCRVQSVVPGTTRIAVYVTCLEYTGWVATSVITKADDGETIVMERVSGPDWSHMPS